jgi:hypothetical protein
MSLERQKRPELLWILKSGLPVLIIKLNHLRVLVSRCILELLRKEDVYFLMMETKVLKHSRLFYHKSVENLLPDNSKSFSVWQYLPRHMLPTLSFRQLLMILLYAEHTSKMLLLRVTLSREWSGFVHFIWVDWTVVQLLWLEEFQSTLF